MKQLIKRGILVFFVFLLCGCSMVSTNMTINKNKQVTISYIIGLDNSYLENKSFQEIFSSKTLNTIKNNGYTVTNYSDDDIYGYKITMNIDNIDTISDSYDKEINILELLNSNIENELYIFKREEGFLKNKYTANFIVDMSNIVEEYQSYLSSENYLGNVSYKFSLSLPYEVESHNATNISSDKKTLEWDYSNIMGSINKINFTFSLYNKQMVYMVYIFIGLVILIIINIIVRIIISIEDAFKRLNKRRFERAQKRMEKKILKKERKEQDKRLKEQLNDVRPESPNNRDIVKNIFNDLDKKSNNEISQNVNNSGINNMTSQNMMYQNSQNNPNNINNQTLVNNNQINNVNQMYNNQVYSNQMNNVNKMNSQNVNKTNEPKKEESLYIKRNVVSDYINNVKDKVKGIFKKKDKNKYSEENNTNDKNIM